MFQKSRVDVEKNVSTSLGTAICVSAPCGMTTFVPLGPVTVPPLGPIPVLLGGGVSTPPQAASAINVSIAPRLLKKFNAVLGFMFFLMFF
jgi:hypothetical protein